MQKWFRATTAATIGIAAWASTVRGAAIDVVSSGEFAAFSNGLLYDLTIPTTSPGWNTASVLATDSRYKNYSAGVANGSFTRVAYFFELGGATAAGLPNGWVWVSFDVAGLTNRADRLGIPSSSLGYFFQQNISNMTVESNVAGIVTGTGITTGNIEFWPSNYNEGNTRSAGNGGAVPNAQGDLGTGNLGFDWGDGGAGTSNGHASMQIHNYDIDGAGSGTEGQTLFSYGAWGAVRTSEVGIGNNPASATTTQAPDWTLTANAASWTTKNLQVFIDTTVVTPEPAALGLLAAVPVCLARRRRRA